MDIKQMKIEEAPKISKHRKSFGTSLYNRKVIEESTLFLEASDSLLKKVDEFITRMNLNEGDAREFLKLIEDTFSEGYVLAIN